MECISYKDGYIYQLTESHISSISILPEKDIVTDYIELTTDGKLTLKKGYAWDGPSGPTVDTLNFMRGSLVHDALYQLMRGEFLNHNQHRKVADKLLQKMCKEDGMSRIRAWWVYHGLRLGGGPAAKAKNKKMDIKAPRACQFG
jgi:hypothetical protein